MLFAGGTVCIALLGMLVLGFSFLNGRGDRRRADRGAAPCWPRVTLLPALLGLLGPRVLSRRQRRRAAAPSSRASTARARRVDEVGGHRAAPPRALAAAAAVVMLALAVPVLHLRLGISDQGNDPASSTTRKAYDLLADGFGPGFNGPLVLVAQPGSARRRGARSGPSKRGCPTSAASPACARSRRPRARRSSR